MTRRTRKDDGSQWTVADSRSLYGIRHWGSEYFSIDDGDKGVGNVEGKDNPAAEQELGAPGAVQSPADNGGEGKAAHGHGGEEGHPISIDGGEAGDGQFLKAFVMAWCISPNWLR